MPSTRQIITVAAISALVYIALNWGSKRSATVAKLTQNG